MSESQKNALKLKMISHIDLQKPDENQLVQSYTVTFSADTPKQAKQLLKNYLSYINDKSAEHLKRELDGYIQTEIKRKESVISDIEQVDKLQKEDKIKSLKSALKNANDRGKARLGTNDSIVGKQTLKRQLQSLESGDYTFPVDYYEQKQNLSKLKGIGGEDYSLEAFAYDLKPEEPIHRDKPKRKLIVLLGLFLGVIVGGIWVLLAQAIRERKTQKA